MTAKAIFKSVYGDSTNFMTPDVLEYGELPKDRYYELSEGEGFDREPIFGVTVVFLDYDGKHKRSENESKLVFSMREARQYIEQLKEGVR